MNAIHVHAKSLICTSKDSDCGHTCMYTHACVYTNGRTYAHRILELINKSVQKGRCQTAPCHRSNAKKTWVWQPFPFCRHMIMSYDISFIIYHLLYISYINVWINRTHRRTHLGWVSLLKVFLSKTVFFFNYFLSSWFRTKFYKNIIIIDICIHT